MAEKLYSVRVIRTIPGILIGANVEVSASGTAGPDLVQIRKAFEAKYGAKYMNSSNMSCFEVRPL